MSETPIASQSFVLDGIRLWTAEQSFSNCRVTVKDGVVEDIAPLDGEGSWVLMPSGVDPQVHLRIPGQTHKETAETGMRACLWGGIGAILTMPNTTPVIDTPERVRETEEAIRPWAQRFGIDVRISAAISVGQKGEALVDFSSLAEAGVAAFTDDGLGLQSDSLMAEAFRQLAPLGLPLLQHAEVCGHGGALAPGPVQESSGTTPYSPAPEVQMVERDLRLLAQTPGARYHVLHVSSRGTLELVKAAKQKKLRATCEVTPHHLLYTSADIEADNLAFKMNPPLRDAADREALVDGLAQGLVDWVATDHAPHDTGSKGDNFQGAAFGTVGLETSLKTLLELHLRGKLPATRLVQVFSTLPARFLGLGREWGDIRVGQPLRGILVDVDAPRRPVVDGDIKSLSKNSCFLGTPLPGELRAHFTEAGAFRLTPDPEGWRRIGLPE